MSRPLLIVLIAWGVGLSGWIFLSQGGTTGQQPAQLYDGWSNQLVSPAGMLPPNIIPIKRCPHQLTLAQLPTFIHGHNHSNSKSH